MQLSQRQTILIVALSALVLLLTVAAVLIFTPGDREAPAEPTATPAATAPPTATATPAATLAPTVFRLPLVPQWDTPQPTAEPLGAGAFLPPTAPPPGTASPWVGAYDEHTRDILAVGLHSGRAAALLMLRLDGQGLTVAALPTDVQGPQGQLLEAASLPGKDLEEQGAQAAQLVEAATGRRYGAWVVLDLGCLPALLQVTGPLRGQEEALAGNGSERAQGALILMTEAVACVQRLPLLQFPALKRAVGEGFGSNLTVRELWSLFWTVRGGVPVRGLLVPVQDTAAGRQADLSGLQNFFQDSC